MNLRQKISVGVLDFAVLAELCISLYMSSTDPANYASLFCTYFLMMAVPTLIIAGVAIRRLSSSELGREK